VECTFGSDKTFAFTICEKCLAKAFDLAFLSLSLIPFMKVLFTKCFVWLSGKTK